MSSHSFLGASCSLLFPGRDPGWRSRFVISYGYYLGDQAEHGLVWASCLTLQRGVARPHLASRYGLTGTLAVLSSCCSFTLHAQSRHPDGSWISLVPFGPSPLSKDMRWEKPMITLSVHDTLIQSTATRGQKPVGSILCAQIPRSLGSPD